MTISCEKLSGLCKFTKSSYQKYLNLAEKYLSSLLLFAIRIWIGLVFFKSGMTKIANIDQAVLLFTYEYNVPLLSPKIAAILAMIFELGCGALIIAGLLTRIAVFPLIGMALVIQFFVFQNPEHFYWLFLLSTLAIYGGGKLSVDAICCKFCKSK